MSVDLNKNGEIDMNEFKKWYKVRSMDSETTEVCAKIWGYF